MLATAGAREESTLRLWNAQDGRMLASFDKFPGGALQLLFSPDQRMLISANMDQTIRIWDVSNPALVPPPRILIGHTLEVWRLALMPDGKTLISGGKDGSVRFWDLTRPPSHRGSITLPGGPFVGWSFSGNDSALLTCDSKGRITRWSGEAWQTTNILRETGGSATTACFLPDRQEVAIASNEQGLRVFRWTDSALPRVLPAFVQNEGVWVLRRHGNRLAVGRFDQQLVRDFEIDTWELKESWGAPGTFAAMDFSRDGRYCVMGGFRGQVLVRNMVNGQESSFVEAMPNIGILGDHRCGPVAFSTFSDRVAICSQQGFARLWETGSWRDAGVIGGFLHAVAGLAFSPEGTRLAAGSSGEEAIRLYEMERYQALVTLGAEGVGFVPAFDASGNILAGMNTAGKLHIWRAPSWREIEEKERTADRPGMR
jgi:WD40 repeat protein